MNYQKPDLMNFNYYDNAVVQGSSPAPCSGVPCGLLPNSGGGPLRSVKPLVLDSNGNPVIASDK